MNRTHTTAGLAAVALVAALTPLVATAGPVSAAGIGETEVAIYLAAAKGSQDYGVYRRPTAGGSPVKLVAPAKGVSRFDLAISQDGSRYAYGEAVFQGNERAPVRERVVVRDVAGPFKRVVLDRAYVDGSGLGDVALSPDGRSVAWTEATFGARGADPTFALWKSSVFGTPSQVPGSAGLTEPVFASSETLLGFDVRGSVNTLRSIPVAGGPTALVSNALGNASDLRLSPSGAAVAYQDFAPSSGEVSTRVAPVVVTAGGVAIDTAHAVTVTTGDLDASVGWRRDGSSLAFTRAATEDAPGDLWTASLTAPASVLVPPTPEDETEVVIGRIDAISPGVVLSISPARLTATSATIPLDVRPADSDWSGTYYRRTTGTTTVTKLAPVATSVVDTGLSIGQTYSYVFAAVDSSGNVGPWSPPRALTATEPPRFLTTDPTSSQSQQASFPVLLSLANASTTRYDVLSGRNGGPYEPWISRQPGASQTFGGPARPGFVATVSQPGSSYRFSGVAFDAFGNRTSSMGTRQAAVVPFDEDVLTPQGRTAVVPRGTAYGLRTLWLLGRGSQASVRLTGDRLQVIGERGPTVGRFDVLVDGVQVATVEPAAPTRLARQVLFSRAVAFGPHLVVIRDRDSAVVVVDAVSARRPR